MGPPFRCSATPSALPLVARSAAGMISCSQTILPVRASSASARGCVECLDDGAAVDEHHAVMHQRRDLVHAHRQRPAPGRAQRADIRAVDLLQRAVALRIVAAPPDQPVLRRRTAQHLVGDRRQRIELRAARSERGLVQRPGFAARAPYEARFAIGRGAFTHRHRRLRSISGLGTGDGRTRESFTGNGQVVRIANIGLDVRIGLATDGAKSARRHRRAHTLGKLERRTAAPQRLEGRALQRGAELPAFQARAMAGDADARIGGLATCQLGSDGLRRACGQRKRRQHKRGQRRERETCARHAPTRCNRA
jgi:hypothetical protein